jgi:V8-like Glu-specific endopeptidase
MKCSLNAVLVFMTSLILSCGVSPSNSELDVVNGDDNRVSLSVRTSLPIASVGRLVTKLDGNQFYTCTASFIARDLVLTAAHCLLNEDGTFRSNATRFFPNIFEKPSSFEAGFEVTYVWRDQNYGKGSIEQNRLMDWAVLRVNGSSENWLNLISEDLQAGAYLTTISYPLEKSAKGWTPFAETNCVLNANGSGESESGFWSSCDVTKGASGGPVLAFDPNRDIFWIAGINVGEGSTLDGSFHLKASYLASQISRLN